ncbi:agglutinin [Quercus suber]|uniref:Agglutinin n=1 Tax=Quercus suber TaxID=58331 RepID=A0AAW0KYB1_QUESU
MEEFLTGGPWGGKGGNPWSFVENNGGIIGMKIVHADVIDSITFKCGDEYGLLQHSKKVGGNGGSKTNEISLNWPEEYLISFSCTTMKFRTHIVIRSLSFKTNKTEYGPYGTVAGQPFSYRMEGGVIVGFHGRAGDYVDAIGAYVKIMPKEDNTLKMVLPVPRGPGGGGGGWWRMAFFPAICELQLHIGDSVIHAIRVLYESKDGEPVWSPKHGGDGDKTEVSKEFLVRIAGFYRPVKGSDSFKALRSITFYTNKAKYGPYGDEIGDAFTSCVAAGKVVGFHGRSGVYLDAIGVHMEYF